MTSTKSFFNKGIYLNTLRRFRLGSAAYFLLLFLCVPLPLLTSGAERLTNSYFSLGRTAFVNEKSLLFDSGFLTMPLLLAFCVPTVVALLVFNSLHSPRHAIFVHSLPVTRRENFVSSLAAAFTLMWIPVLLITGLLLVMSVCGYSRVIGITPVFMWLAVQLFVTTVMFAVAAFSATVSANGFAVVAINALLLGAPLIIAAGAQLAADQFLFGFLSQSTMFEKIIKLSPPCYIAFAAADNPYRLFTHFPVWLFLGAAILLYAFSLYLYKRRKIELCGDVAAYKPVKICLKYGVCAAMFVGCFGIFYCGLEMSFTVFVLLSVLLCGAAYFACEMLLQKNLRVFGKWRGLCGFFAVCAVLSATVVLTPFGYETRIPEKSDIARATVFGYYSVEEPFSADERVIDAALDFHRQCITDIPLTQRTVDKNRAEKYQYDLSVYYELKNGNTLVRHYPVSTNQHTEVMEKLFAVAEYKETLSGCSALVPENITSLTVRSHMGDYEAEDIIAENTDEFFTALKKDIDKISYGEYRESLLPYVSIGFDDNYRTNKHIFREELYKNQHYISVDFTINENYTETIAFLKKCGIWDKVRNDMYSNTYITPYAFTKRLNKSTDETEIVYDTATKPDDVYCSTAYLSKVDTADAKHIFSADYNTRDFYDLPDGEYYAVFVTKSDGRYISAAACYIEKNALPDYLKNYIKAN